MSPLKTYNIFISHAWSYHEEYDKIVEFLNESSYFSWKNHSVPKDNALDTTNNKELVDALYNQIKSTNIVIILAGMYASYSKWIETEIAIAQNYEKPIIGIKPWGNQKIPSQVSDTAKEIIGWNTNSIIEAIRKYSI